MISKVIKGFITSKEAEEIILFTQSLNSKSNIENEHISSVASKLNGKSFMFDISKTKLSNELSTFQSSDNLMNVDVDKLFIDILERISINLNINKDNVFLQILCQDVGGLIHPHYDSSTNGFITYKCNICVDSDDYRLFVGDEFIDVKNKDLYCFEASLYKHWTEPLINKRIILSYGFILPYKDLGRTNNDPRVRMSQRIEKFFQNK